MSRNPKQIKTKTPYPARPPALAAASVRGARAVIMEVRSAMGGEDSAVFAGELARAYLRCAEREGWRSEILEREALGAGWRLTVLRLEGKGVNRLACEAGTHRVTREPGNDRSGRRHTSAVTVAVLPVSDNAVSALDMRDVKVDTFRSSGAGGQNMQKTESAVRVTHRPTGLKAVVQDERSQASNKQRALELLAARISARAQSGARALEDQLRRGQVGSGHISERVRTYAWRERLVIDHRLGLTVKLDAVLAGDLRPFMARQQG